MTVDYQKALRAKLVAQLSQIESTDKMILTLIAFLTDRPEGRLKGFVLAVELMAEGATPIEVVNVFLDKYEAMGGRYADAN